jgi:hypothetical protein
MIHNLRLDVHEALEDRSYHIHDISNPHIVVCHWQVQLDGVRVD